MQKGRTGKCGREKKRPSGSVLIFLSHIFAVRPVKISLDIRMREYYFHSVLAQ